MQNRSHAVMSQRVDAHDASILISFALQHGASLRNMGAAMLRGEDGVAHALFGSLIDAAMRAYPDDCAPADPAPTPAPIAPAVAEELVA